jgi:hypothetical protein
MAHRRTFSRDSEITPMGLVQTNYECNNRLNSLTSLERVRVNERKPEMAEDWNLKPGDQIRRTELHRQFGGSGQGGISPSAKSPNVLIFTDPKTGVQHGYYDGWKDDGLFHYTDAAWVS